MIPALAFLGAGILATTTYLASVDAVQQAAIYDLVAIGAFGAIVAGVLINRPANGRAWLVIALGVGCWGVGDLVWDYYDLVLGEAPFPSWADGSYLAAYPLLAIGLLWLVRSRERRLDVAGLIDAAIVTSGFALAFSAFVVVPTLTDPEITDLQRVVATLYPVGDVLLLAVTVRFVFWLQGATASACLLVATPVLWVVADGLYAQQLLDYASWRTWLEVLWILAYVAIGLAALHPSIARPLRVREPNLDISWGRLAVLMAASLLAPVVLAVEWASGMEIDAPLIALASAALFALVVIRIAGLVSALRLALVDRESLATELRKIALHDTLTGLANRAVFADRLDHALARRDPDPAVGLIFLDIDDFKAVNDGLGHAAGDALLRAVAARIVAAVRPEDTAARLGGDEFGVIIDRVESADAICRIAARVKEAVERPVHVGDRTIAQLVSVGTAIGSPGRADPDDLLREADLAMYAEKRERLRVAPSGLPARGGIVRGVTTGP